MFVQPPVPPPAPPVPPPAEPVPPPAPEPEPLAPPLVPVPLPAPLPPDGEPGVLSGGMGELLVEPDLVPVASAPSLAANVAAEPVASRPINNSEVSLRVTMVCLRKGDLPDIGQTRRTLGAGRMTSGQKSTVADTFSVRGVPWVR
ncbi:hypothetical protein DOZ69_20270 [Pseudomonas fluorescens]|nr:hypothetical protein DOZ69_20270 [Pseudomonas fluorescens]